MSKKHYVTIFDMSACMNNPILHRHMLNAEEHAQKDGHQVQCDDGAGLLTYVAFDTPEEALLFQLKYL